MSSLSKVYAKQNALIEGSITTLDSRAENVVQKAASRLLRQLWETNEFEALKTFAHEFTRMSDIRHTRFADELLVLQTLLNNY